MINIEPISKNIVLNMANDKKIHLITYSLLKYKTNQLLMQQTPKFIHMTSLTLNHMIYINSNRTMF